MYRNSAASLKYITDPVIIEYDTGLKANIKWTRPSIQCSGLHIYQAPSIFILKHTHYIIPKAFFISLGYIKALFCTV